MGPRAVALQFNDFLKIRIFPKIAYKLLSYFASFSDTRGRILTNDPDPESPEAPAPSYIPQTPEKRPESLQKMKKTLKSCYVRGYLGLF